MQLELKKSTIDMLCKLGLTPIQAKIFACLVIYGQQKIQTISERSSTDRANTYQAITQLQKIGLVDKIMTSPVFCKAIPYEEGISLLMKQKEKEYHETVDQASKLLLSFQSMNQNNKCDNEARITVITNDRASALVFRETRLAKRGFDFIFDKKTFSSSFMDHAKLQIAGMKHLKYRILIEKLFLNKKNMKILQAFLREPNCKIKFIEFPPLNNIVIKDGIEVAISLQPDNSGLKFLAISNEGCVKIFVKYFEDLWNQAIAIPLEIEQKTENPKEKTP